MSKGPKGVDIGKTDDILKMERWTPEEKREKEHKAALAVVHYLGHDCLDILQMLGLAPYESADRPRNKTPIIHGERAGYTNRGCGREGAPPCPASPTCTEANNEYFRQRRAAARTTTERNAA